MFNSKDKEEKISSKSPSFNKSKSISSAIDDLEMGRPISKAVPDSEIDVSTSSEDLEESSSSLDLEVIEELKTKSNKSNYDDLSSFLDEDDEEVELTNEEDEEIGETDEIADEEVEESIFVSPIEDEPNNLNIDEEVNFTTEEEKEFYSLLEDEELVLSRPAKKSDKSFNSSFANKFVSRPAKKSDKSFNSSFANKFSNKFNFNFIKNRSKILQGNKLSTKSKIFAILGLILGLVFIIYGILNFNNVSDRVIDHVLLGEAGSWSIILILIGLIIILFDVFYVFYYKNSLKNSNIKNAQIRNTFDTIDKIKSIDSDYYQRESDEDSIFNNILKLDKEESSDNIFKNSIFNKEDEIIVDHSIDDLDEIIVEEPDDVADFYSEGDINLSDDVADLDVGSLDENSIFDDNETLSNPIEDELEIVPEVEEVSELEKYDDLSSFLDDDDDDVDEDSLDDSKFKKSADIDSLIGNSIETKSNSKEDLAAKKARIIEGTNFDNSLRKSK